MHEIPKDREQVELRLKVSAVLFAREFGAFDFHVTIAVNAAAALLKTGETLQRQLLQGRPLGGEAGADLLAGGAVDARIGDGLFPVEQEAILLRQAGGSRHGIRCRILGVTNIRRSDDNSATFASNSDQSAEKDS